MITDASPERDPASSVIALGPATFDALYQAEYSKLVGLGYVLSGSRPVAEELVQDSFTEAHRRWGQISTYDNPGAWLRRVLVNKATSRRRKVVSEAKAVTRLGRRRAEDVTIPESSGDIWAAVRRLPTRQAQAVALHYLEDMTVAQIAEVLGCGEETVKTHLKRGRARLADVLGAEQEEEAT